MIGFVPQAYILYDELTVYENIMFAARMRGPADEDPARRQRRVEAVLRLLGLQECRDFVLDKSLGVGLSINPIALHESHVFSRVSLSRCVFGDLLVEMYFRLPNFVVLRFLQLYAALQWEVLCGGCVQ